MTEEWLEKVVFMPILIQSMLNTQLTIIRTDYNFCETYKLADGEEHTPAHGWNIWITILRRTNFLEEVGILSVKIFIREGNFTGGS
jgi:hypothetical protein